MERLPFDALRHIKRFLYRCKFKFVVSMTGTSRQPARSRCSSWDDKWWASETSRDNVLLEICREIAVTCAAYERNYPLHGASAGFACDFSSAAFGFSATCGPKKWPLRGDVRKVIYHDASVKLRSADDAWSFHAVGDLSKKDGSFHADDWRIVERDARDRKATKKVLRRLAITRASDLTGPLRRHTTTSSEEIVAFCGWEESEGPEDDGGRKINNADRQLDDGALKRLMSDLLG